MLELDYCLLKIYKSYWLKFNEHYVDVWKMRLFLSGLYVYMARMNNVNKKFLCILFLMLLLGDLWKKYSNIQLFFIFLIKLKY